MPQDATPILIVVNILITSGVLWKLIGAARGYGRLEEKVDGHEKRIVRIEDRVIGGRE